MPKFRLNSSAPYRHIPVEGGVVACDTETTGLNPYGTPEERGHYPDRPFLFTFTDYKGTSYGYRCEVDPFTRRVKYEEADQEILNEIRRWMQDENITKVFHNANFDITMMEMALGVKFKGRIWDTKVLAHVQNSGLKTYALKPLCDQFFGISDEDQKDLITSVHKARRLAKKKGWKIAETHTHGSKCSLADYWLGDRDLCMTYGITDTERTMRLYWAYETCFDDEDYLNIITMEMDTAECLREMQEYGSRLDDDKIAECLRYYKTHIRKAEAIKKKLGYESLNTKSHKQMCEVFYDKLGKDVILGKSGNPSVDSSALSLWASQGDELASCIMDINASSHHITTFIEPFQKLGYRDDDGAKLLHPNYNSVGPVTGRISCNRPNLMNIPSNDSRGRKTDVEYRARECFIPRENCVLYFPDYAQVEVWLAMFLSGDEFGVEQLKNGMDMHGNVAARPDIFGARPDWEEKKTKYRKVAKIIMFGLIYGGGPGVVDGVVGTGMDEAKRIYSAFWKQFPGLAQYGQDLASQCKKNGYITNPFGRKYFPHPMERYKALNYMIQGTAADVMKRAMINTRNLFKEKFGNRPRVLMTIHDELCVEIPKDLHSHYIMDEVTKAMQGDMHETCGLPCHFKVGMKWTPTNWREVIELEDRVYGHDD